MESDPIKRVVIVGGPCAGKSSVMLATRIHFLNTAEYIPEAATILLEGGFPAPGEDVTYSPEWQNEFQKSVSSLQLSLEGLVRQRSLRKGTKLEIADRGLWDGAVYLPGGAEEFESLCGITREAAYSRYDAVIHLQSLAVASEVKYERLRTSNNSHRYEDLAAARHLEERTVEEWSAHPNWHLIEGDDLSSKTSRVIKIIEGIGSVKAF